MLFNFVGLTAITQFDEFFYENITDDEFKGYLKNKDKKETIKKLFRIETTTSWQSDGKDEIKQFVPELEHNDEGQNPIKLKKCRCGESGWRGILFVVYKFLRVLYVSTWYYFAPFLAIILSYVVPLLARNQLSIGTIEETPGQ